MRATTTLPLAALFVLASACHNSASDAPHAATTSAAVAAPASAPAANAEHLTFGPPNSRVTFVGTKMVGHHDGGFDRFTGTLDLSPEHLEASRVTVDIEMASVNTDTERLTGHLRSGDFFDAEHFPHSTFTSTEIRAGGANGATHTITGNLTMRGQTHGVTFPATIAVTPGEVTANAEFTINRRDWGIVYAGMPDNLIHDEVLIRLAIHAPRAAH